MKLPINYNEVHYTVRKKAREQYVELQDGKCYYCKQDLNIRPKQDKKINWKLFPPNFLRYPLHLHHNHNTGMTIGTVHAYCNAVLWQYHKE